MTQHKYAEMIKIKAYNMDLVVFIKNIADDDWRIRGNQDSTYFEPTCEYFLCLPQHKEACLHWLNGGVAQLEYTHASYPYWNNIDNDDTDWSKGHVFMDESLNIRIKPKKVRRWLAVHPSGETTTHYSDRKSVEQVVAQFEPFITHHQIIQIEVEMSDDN